MKNFFSESFKDSFKKLPALIMKQANKAFSLVEENPRATGLRLKCVNAESKQYSIRIGKDYRALGYLEGDTIKWDWIGPHDEYKRRID